MSARAMAGKREPGRKGDAGVDVVEKPQSKPKVQRPRLCKVLLHNDDFTPMWFVVQTLIEVFFKSESDAQSIMLHAHTRGYAVAGVYSHEVAETKVDETMKKASEAGFPLLCTMEPEEGTE